MFRYQSEQHTFWLGEVKQSEATAVAAKVDYWLMRLKQNLVTLPPGCDIVTFLQHDGHPPDLLKPGDKTITLEQLRDAYLRSQENKLEQTTLDGIRLHFGHLVRILKPSTRISTIGRAALQAYVDNRSSEWIDPNVYRRKRRERLAALPPRKNRKRLPPPEAEDKPLRHPSAATIKKEIISLRTAWNWARRHLELREEFPGTRLDFAKTEESLPFMPWEEAERRVEQGDSPEKVWDSVYLRPHEVDELLEWVKARPVSPWVYPMLAFAAHTGARRSEIVRATPADIDLKDGFVTIREKKRVKKKLTTRRVPMTPLLKQILTKWMLKRGKGTTFFCKADGGPITPREALNYFQRTLRLSKWRVLKGLHVFRHSLISALASKDVDQRVIDEIAGHSTDEQRRRYRHLFPDVTKSAFKLVFA